MNSRPDSRAPEYGPAEPQNELRPVVSGRRARHGVIGHNVRYVLGFALAAVVIAFLVLYLVSFG